MGGGIGLRKGARRRKAIGAARAPVEVDAECSDAIGWFGGLGRIGCRLDRDRVLRQQGAGTAQQERCDEAGRAAA